MNHPSERWLEDKTWERNYYSNSIDVYSSLPMEKMVQRLLTELGKLQWRTFLEVGCAYGCSMSSIIHRFPDRMFWGIDFSDWAIKKAREIFKSFVNVRFDVKNAKDLSYFQDKMFDVVMCSNLLSSVSTDDKFDIFMEMYRVSKKYVIIARDFNENYASDEDIKFCMTHPHIDLKVLINPLLAKFEFSRIIVIPLEKNITMRHLNCLWICEKS
jgi:ubiquinone/menaquinone biosynthesis C-methylase UbiE